MAKLDAMAAPAEMPEEMPIDEGMGDSGIGFSIPVADLGGAAEGDTIHVEMDVTVDSVDGEMANVTASNVSTVEEPAPEMEAGGQTMAGQAMNAFGKGAK
jgi:hypothetical protein